MKLRKVLAAVFCVAFASAMFAATALADPIKELGPTDEAKLAVGKSLATGSGTTVPDDAKAFSFTFTPVQVNVDDGATGNTAQHPSVAPADCPAIPASGTLGANLPAAVTKSEGGNDYYQVNTANFLAGVTFPAEGIYVYEVTEAIPASLDGWNKADNVFTRTQDNYDETLTYSKAKYELRIYTKEDPGTGNIYISAITCVPLLTDSGEVPSDDPKVDPTLYDETEFVLSGLLFNNRYERVLNTDPDDPDGQPWELVKKVTNVDGDNGILHNPAMKFNFTITLTKADGSSLGDSYNDVRLFASDNGTTWVKDDTFTSPVFTFDANGVATATVELAHNEKVTFPNLPAGTQITVVENDYYTLASQGTNIDPNTNQPREYKFHPIYSETVGSGTPTAGTDYTTAPTEADRTAAVSLTDQPTSTGCENKGDLDTGTTPAGIIMQYLPFFVMIALAVAALLALTVAKGTRRARTAQ